MTKRSTPSEASISHLLHRAVQISADLYSEQAGPEAITPRQFAVLTAVAEAEGATQSQLVRSTGVDRSTLAELLTRLTARGLVARLRSAGDARVNQVSLTESGRALLAATEPHAAAADLALLSRLPEDRRARFLKDLRRLVAPGAKAKVKKKKKGARKDDGAPPPETAPESGS
ncbi:MarR family winged helix-turn-helix transcriptional regulator [Phenylobacterium sp.]|jgi:DNA-binding MarR family transcriptional regulator|uniref:MarR family winged helix-turn-helix transcriptional regulator n=1 Tax=Phenylobacterium sp. TaxID=1871053 RepID=UPI0025D8CFC3|nr:MarR family winged helix-turn-helix transcriptional regulator [Phenylobacterium sp.]MCA6286444.1 winged helix-turn-helix transcriptional regulator [Phenylobacterium sp.]MCA6289928.1 winged helix-turn-helix transcriptional regulator [Phenylobacterium sp.]MCA6309267.1 winged helix-turn-helix transcriptional regulator [Phenylobacterium sp.]MCA6322921.1 winged helix-turn-helix transcriptional regulator [Phenylobacterium sp.]MCA6336828.1 winged helix-turn-helix transcriptional regulator [Phenylo